MEKLKLFGDIYDIIACYILIIVGIGLFVYSFINNHKGFLFSGLVLIVVFGALLLFSYYARYKNKFTKFKADFKSVIATILVVLLMIAATLLIIYIFIG